MTWFLTTRLGRWLAVAAGVVFAVLGAWVAGRRDGAQKERSRRDRDYIETRKRIDDAQIVDDEHHALEWLRSRDTDKR